ncbi:RE1 silencing transcription factor [Rhinolophus ferrumequinum]|uniref:RE1 silencing transcription factor n=1 Tax=Rhinolophus ferrumequinum TaxID=59479 RepID=A0A7J7ZDZ6_RHIFE|nr:RE1 silencing transcription factor [Rhinolophus ferrumequinum]
MATQVMGQSSGGGGLFNGSGNIGMALPNDMYDLHDLSKAELAAPQLIMLANVALTGEVNGSCCDYLVGEERQMAELMPVGDNNFSDSDGEGLEESPEIKEEGDFSKGPIRCDRCGYNTNRYDHYTAHLKHHTRAGDNERVYKCIICTYTTVSEYHWRKHLRNHFPRKVYTCGKCNYFSDRKNNYVQHVRTHTGERPYKCELCPYSSSQKTHLTRHMRTHSEKGEAVSKTAVASSPVTMAIHESQEMDEDEGIHSHDGSDLSDNMSEGSDDSGLNGARPIPQGTSRKNAKEALVVKVAEGDFVCIFCDRSFRKEKDYSKHLNRHLVNVYFLEKAAKGQE